MDQEVFYCADEEGIVVADCDLRATLHAKRAFDAVGHYGRTDVLARSLLRPLTTRPLAVARAEGGQGLAFADDLDATDEHAGDGGLGIALDHAPRPLQQEVVDLDRRAVRRLAVEVLADQPRPVPGEVAGQAADRLALQHRGCVAPAGRLQLRQALRQRGIAPWSQLHEEENYEGGRDRDTDENECQHGDLRSRCRRSS